jgi:hypothetical protein
VERVTPPLHRSGEFYTGSSVFLQSPPLIGMTAKAKPKSAPKPRDLSRKSADALLIKHGILPEIIKSKDGKRASGYTDGQTWAVVIQKRDVSYSHVLKREQVSFNREIWSAILTSKLPVKLVVLIGQWVYLHQAEDFRRVVPDFRAGGRRGSVAQAWFDFADFDHLNPTPKPVDPKILEEEERERLVAALLRDTEIEAPDLSWEDNHLTVTMGGRGCYTQREIIEVYGVLRRDGGAVTWAIEAPKDCDFSALSKPGQ